MQRGKVKRDWKIENGEGRFAVFPPSLGKVEVKPRSLTFVRDDRVRDGPFVPQVKLKPAPTSRAPTEGTEPALRASG